MKIRTGFVSNSSSSSFAIYGIWIDPDDVPKQNRGDDDGEYNFDGLDYIYSQDGDFVVVGRSFDSIGDNETGRQFKNSVNDKLSKIFGANFIATRQIGSHIDSYEW